MASCTKSHRKSGKGIHELLKISYDALVDDEKEVFLHISCFFKGQNKNYVIDILEGCDLNPKDGIEVLRKMALISITEEGDIWIHDLLEDMGKKIVIQESPTEPGERSRLWRYEDIYHVFFENTVSARVLLLYIENTVVTKCVADVHVTSRKLEVYTFKLLFEESLFCYSIALSY